MQQLSNTMPASADHTFNASDVNRKVTETLLLKALSAHPTARSHNLSNLLLPRAKSTAQSTAPALANLCNVTHDAALKAASLYAIALHFSNRQKPPTPAAIEQVAPTLVNASLTCRPLYSRSQIENQLAKPSLPANSSLAKHKKRICGWISGEPWGDASGSQAASAKPPSLPYDNLEGLNQEKPGMSPQRVSTITDAINRVEGSALAALKLLQTSMRSISEENDNDVGREAAGGGGGAADNETIDENIVLVKSGATTVVSTTVRSPKKSTESQMEDSLLSEISQAGDENQGGVVNATNSEADESSSVASELTLYEDKQPLSSTSIRRAGVAALACIVCCLHNNPNPNSKLSSIKALTASGAIDALLLLAYHEFTDVLEDPSKVSTADVNGGVVKNSLTLSTMPSHHHSQSNQQHSARSTISSSSNTSFSSSIISSSTFQDESRGGHAAHLDQQNFLESTLSRREEVNAFLLYQQNRRDQKTAEIIAKLNDPLVPASELYRSIAETVPNKPLISATQISSQALASLAAEDLKRITILRTAALRKVCMHARVGF